MKPCKKWLKKAKGTSWPLNRLLFCRTLPWEAAEPLQKAGGGVLSHLWGEIFHGGREATTEKALYLDFASRSSVADGVCNIPSLSILYITIHDCSEGVLHIIQSKGNLLWQYEAFKKPSEIFCDFWEPFFISFLQSQECFLLFLQI